MNKRPAWWLLPNLLSLDAPIVAVVWMWIFSKSMRVIYVETYSYWLVAGAVWSIYVLDRILDVWRLKRAEARVERSGDGEDVELPVTHLSPRHHFHWKYRYIFLTLFALVVTYSAYAAFNIASENLLTAGFSGISLVIVYLFARKVDQGEITYFKNFIAGVTFAFGVAAPIVLERMDLYSDSNVMSLSGVYYHFTDASPVSFLRATEFAVVNIFKMTISSVGVVMFQSFLPILFALLCFLNITAIDLWQKSRDSEDEGEKEICEAIIGTGLIILVASSVFLAAFRLTETERILAYVVMISAAMLQMLNKKRSLFYLDGQRVLADFLMILPIPIVWILAEESAY